MEDHELKCGLGEKGCPPVIILTTEVDGMKEEVKSLSTKFWAVILMLVANLAGIGVMLFKVVVG